MSGFEEYVKAFGGPSVYARLNPRWEVGVSLSEDGFTAVSFVNGIHTLRGGTHLNAVADTLCKKLAVLIGKHAQGVREKVSCAILRCNRCVRRRHSHSRIRSPFLAMFCERDGEIPLGGWLMRRPLPLLSTAVCQVPNASFDSQSKDSCVTKIEDPPAITDRFVKSLCDELGLADLVLAAMKSKEELVCDCAAVHHTATHRKLLFHFPLFMPQAFLRQVKKSKQAGVIRGIPKLEDANEAGGKRASECTLILTEGDSAKVCAQHSTNADVPRDRVSVFPAQALAVAGLSVVGRDLYGVFPLRGKLLNVRSALSSPICVCVCLSVYALASLCACAGT